MPLLDCHIRQIAGGDRNAFQKLHHGLYHRLFYYAYKVLGDTGECEDLVQDVFVHYWENRTTFTELVAVKVYLYTLLDNKVKNQYRKKRRHDRLIGQMPEVKNIPGEHLIISSEISAQVRQAIRELPAQTRRILELSLLEMTQEEIAAEMNISVNTVKTLKKGGYRVLRESLAHLKTLLPAIL